MKLLISLFFISFLTATNNEWLTDLGKAKEKATQDNKFILLNFSGSDWCVPCIRLHKEIFDSKEFETFAQKNLVLVNADFPRLRKNQLTKEKTKENEALADQYDHEGKFPLTLLLDANGKVMKSWEGYSNLLPEKFVAEINSIIHAVN